MRVKHRERKDDENDIIFQCGWYRGILRDFLGKAYAFPGFFIHDNRMFAERAFLLFVENLKDRVLFFKRFPSRTLSYLKECTEYGIHDRCKQKGNLRDR